MTTTPLAEDLWQHVLDELAELEGALRHPYNRRAVAQARETLETMSFASEGGGESVDGAEN